MDNLDPKNQAEMQKYLETFGGSPMAVASIQERIHHREWHSLQQSHAARIDKPCSMKDDNRNHILVEKNESSSCHKNQMALRSEIGKYQQLMPPRRRL